MQLPVDKHPLLEPALTVLFVSAEKVSVCHNVWG